jgi:hypothetical protein
LPDEIEHLRELRGDKFERRAFLGHALPPKPPPWAPRRWRQCGGLLAPGVALGRQVAADLPLPIKLLA